MSFFPREMKKIFGSFKNWTDTKRERKKGRERKEGSEGGREGGRKRKKLKRSHAQILGYISVAISEWSLHNLNYTTEWL